MHPGFGVIEGLQNPSMYLRLALIESPGLQRQGVPAQADSPDAVLWSSEHLQNRRGGDASCKRPAQTIARSAMKRDAVSDRWVAALALIWRSGSTALCGTTVFLDPHEL